MFPGQSYNIWGDFFHITFVENPGIAFGIDFGAQFKLVISIFTLLASIGVLYYLYLNRSKELSLRLSLAFILGGAVGNLIDRVFYGLLYGYAPLFRGSVVDFFNFKMFNFYLFNRTFGNYIFNVADVAVTVGVLLLIISFNRRNSEAAEEEPKLENYLADNKD